MTGLLAASVDVGSPSAPLRPPREDDADIVPEGRPYHNKGRPRLLPMRDCFEAMRGVCGELSRQLRSGDPVCRRWRHHVSQRLGQGSNRTIPNRMARAATGAPTISLGLGCHVRENCSCDAV
jgi:hypothetical protein